jgi:hypothetical protein
MWPAPSMAISGAPVSSASRSARAWGWQRSSSPWTISSGARTRRQISSTSSLESAKGASTAANITSALVSKAQPTQSSICLVECGSGNISEKKNSTKPG